MQRFNVGALDAAVRIALAAGLGFLSVTLNVHLLVSLLIAMVALGMAGSAMLHYCPLYTLLGVTTRHDRGSTPAARHL
jgi:hypothetical protein